MINDDMINDISIEEFAAFLDGNLPENEMDAMADIIDADENYSSIISDSMDIDQYVEFLGDDIYNSMDFDNLDIELPTIPDSDDVELVEVINISDDIEIIDVAAAEEVITEPEVIPYTPEDIDVIDDIDIPDVDIY